MDLLGGGREETISRVFNLMGLGMASRSLQMWVGLLSFSSP